MTIHIRAGLRAVTVAGSLIAALSAAPAIAATASGHMAASIHTMTSGHATSSRSAAGSTWGGPEQANPFMAPGGLGSVHNDSESSNATPQPGPGVTAFNSSWVYSGTVCPTIFLERSGLVIAYCVQTANPFQPVLELLDPTTLAVLASLALPPTGQFSDYPYLDELDRVVVATGTGHILRVATTQDASGNWQLSIVNDWDISRAVTGHCGGVSLCDYVVSVKPDWAGRIWFSTNGGVVGTLEPVSGIVRTASLPAGEQVTKAISASPDGVAVVSDHALYLFSAPGDLAPRIVWRQPYARGSGIKLGQTTDGSGTAPTFFGSSGDQYLTIIDNAVPREHVLVFRADPADDHRLVCSVPVFAADASATDDTSIGIGSTVIATSTAGYNFQNPTNPVPLPGGMTRIDVRPGGSGCHVAWANMLPSDAVPKLSVGDGYLYTFDRTVASGTASYALDVLDSSTGSVLSRQNVGSGPAFETLQLPPMLAPDGTLFESTVAGILRVTPVAGSTRIR